MVTIVLYVTIMAMLAVLLISIWRYQIKLIRNLRVALVKSLRARIALLQEQRLSAAEVRDLREDIDSALRLGVTWPDLETSGEALTALYRLYI